MPSPNIKKDPSLFSGAQGRQSLLKDPKHCWHRAESVKLVACKHWQPSRYFWTPRVLFRSAGASGHCCGIERELPDCEG